MRSSEARIAYILFLQYYNASKISSTKKQKKTKADLIQSLIRIDLVFHQFHWTVERRIQSSVIHSNRRRETTSLRSREPRKQPLQLAIKMMYYHSSLLHTYISFDHLNLTSHLHSKFLLLLLNFKWKHTILPWPTTYLILCIKGNSLNTLIFTCSLLRSIFNMYLLFFFLSYLCFTLIALSLSPALRSSFSHSIPIFPLSYE